MHDRSAPAPSPSGPRLWLLAMVAGLVDTIGFVGLAGLFLAHVTGDLVLVGADVAGAELLPTVGRLAVVVTFVIGIAAVAWLAPRHGPGAERRLLWLEAALLALFTAAGVLLVDVEQVSPSAPLALLVALPGVLAMAVHASLRRIAGGPLTQVMTGNVTTATFDVVDLLAARRQAPGDAALRSAAHGGVMLVLSFFAGVLAAGVLFPRIGFASASIPCVIVAALAIGAGGASGPAGKAVPSGGAAADAGAPAGR